MWIPVTLAAAVFQILRTSRQHQLRSILSVNAAGFVRYTYGFPLAVAATVITFVVLGEDPPTVPSRFWPIIGAAGFAQIMGTLALLRSFDLRDFAIGTVYAKTEIVIVAIVSAVALGEPLKPLGWVAIVLCMAGVAWLAAPRHLGEAVSSIADPAALMGILAAGGFALAAVGIRAASNSLSGAPAFHRALLTLTVMLGMQTALNGTQLFTSAPAEFVNVYRAWRSALPVGILSVCGSAGWAVAVTLTNAAKVRTLGQVELVMAFAISVWWLHEKHLRSEYVASAMVMAGVVGVVALG